MLSFALCAQFVREDWLQLRQEAMDLEGYSSAKLDRVTRYLGVLAEKTRKLGKMSPFGLTNCVDFRPINICLFALF